MAKTMTVEQMRAAVESHDEAYMQSLRDLYSSEQFAYVRDTLAGLAGTYEAHEELAAPIKAIVQIMEVAPGTADKTYKAPE